MKLGKILGNPTLAFLIRITSKKLKNCNWTTEKLFTLPPNILILFILIHTMTLGAIKINVTAYQSSKSVQLHSAFDET